MEDEKMDIEDDNSDNVKSWFSDNLRIIISIVIVVVIAGGIYSYSKKSQTPAADQNQVAVDDQTGKDNSDAEVKPGDQTATDSKNNDQSKSQTSSTTISQETENSFVETAGKGDGVTRLARKALANYLEKNPDSDLKAEHKIYVEDYLRKNAGFKGGVKVGTSVEFSKDMIKQAIDASKNLNDKQLNNLHKYVVRVPSLS
jgi:predicted negative regulator of RcsB-dependent stress response